MGFEVDSKTVVNNICRNAIINKCAHLLGTDLTNTDVKFIRRQANKEFYSTKGSIYTLDWYEYVKLQNREILVTILTTMFGTDFHRN
ncbi:hypothetical protein MTR_4g094840 [Medicago truncatula]|uniref:Uncharacterized protein n=1 Tax=Medicago truncatula TaxID=3880 RepID=A0A072UNR3_MEDTR|nr:hypothetical protein MTR_4g094840 [Medicago truncatula]